MGEELPILKGILNGVVNYHNAPVRFGRVPKREKARILAAMQQSTNSRSQEKAIAAELDDEQRLMETVIMAHLDTSDFTKDKIEPKLRQARENPTYAVCSPNNCPFNPKSENGSPDTQAFSQRFSVLITKVVEFGKRIPGFHLLQNEDKSTLLKAGLLEVLFVRLACLFDSQSMYCLNGKLVKRDAFPTNSSMKFLMESVFDFSERFNALRLSEPEIALFCSVILAAPDRPGLRNTELVERMHNKLKHALQLVLNQNHPNQGIIHELMKKIPDLRTLNTLHSEKLYRDSMAEQSHLAQQQSQQQMWNTIIAEEEVFVKSPDGASTWSSSSDTTMEEVKSPLGSVSSTESMCVGEITSLNDYQSHRMSSAPLLAATLSRGICSQRHRASPPGEDMKVIHRPIRKVDSPSDSGIESGTEKIDKSIGSSPTSVCSSPRSSLEDKDDHHNSHLHHISHNHIEDMPVLKRVLQAPPLCDTNSLMDEAYKPHKKFRALRNKDTAEAEPMQVSPQLHHHLTSTLSSTHSTLARSLMEGPRGMTPEQLKRTDIIHDYIMRGESPSSNDFKYIPSQRWPQNSGTSVITTTTGRSPAYVLVSSPPVHLEQPSKLYLAPSPSSTSPASPSIMELQVGIAQPLNLSKKTPPSSPRPLSAPSTMPQKAVSLEA